MNAQFFAINLKRLVFAEIQQLEFTVLQLHDKVMTGDVDDFCILHMSRLNFMAWFSYCFSGWRMRYILRGSAHSHGAKERHYDERKAECLLPVALHWFLLVNGNDSVSLSRVTCCKDASTM